MRTAWMVATVLVCLTLAPWSHASAAVTVFAQDLAGFEAAAGDPPIAITFDDISPGSDISRTTIAGVIFLAPGAPLIVVRGADTYTPLLGFDGVVDASKNRLPPTTGENVLSPGGTLLGPGPEWRVEDDDLVLVFTNAVSAIGFDHLSQSADGLSMTVVTVFSADGSLLYTAPIPICNADPGVGWGGPGAADFWGVVSDAADIKRVVIDEFDENNYPPDCNIGFDTLRVAAHAVVDTDADGMPDDWETSEGFDPQDPADGVMDADGDGLSNAQEYALGSDPGVRDTDGDSFSDFEEFYFGSSPVDPQAIPVRSTFDDAPVNHWAWHEIEAAYRANIVKGYDDGLYRPEGEITRDQMAVYVARALVQPAGDAGIPDPVPPATLPDVPTTHWAYKHIEYAVSLNVVQGYEDGTYGPDITLDRGQMAVFIARAMVAPGGDAAVPDPVPPATFPDVSSTFWAYKQVEYCVGQGVVKGYEDGKYHPANAVTRDQMAVYVARAFGLL